MKYFVSDKISNGQVKIMKYIKKDTYISLKYLMIYYQELFDIKVLAQNLFA